jgi:hypothetical protein
MMVRGVRIDGYEKIRPKDELVIHVEAVETKDKREQRRKRRTEERSTRHEDAHAVLHPSSFPLRLVQRHTISPPLRRRLHFGTHERIRLDPLLQHLQQCARKRVRRMDHLGRPDRTPLLRVDVPHRSFSRGRRMRGDGSDGRVGLEVESEREGGGEEMGDELPGVQRRGGPGPGRAGRGETHRLVIYTQ